MRLSRFWLPLLGFAAISLLLAVGLKLKPREVPSPLIGRMAPEINLPSLLNPRQNVDTNDLRGRVWVLNVWASWCLACRTEHHLLKEISSSEGVVLIGLNYKDEPNEAILWLNNFGNPYSLIGVDSAGDAAIEWGVYGVPETFIVDVAGFVQYKHVGPLDQNTISSEIMPILARLLKEYRK